MYIVRLASRELVSTNAPGVAGDTRQANPNQRDEVPINRCAVPRDILAHEGDHLRMRQGSLSIGQNLQNRHAGRRHTQSELANPFLDFSIPGLHRPTITCFGARGEAGCMLCLFGTAVARAAHPGGLRLSAGAARIPTADRAWAICMHEQ